MQDNNIHFDFWINNDERLKTLWQKYTDISRKSKGSGFLPTRIVIDEPWRNLQSHVVIIHLGPALLIWIKFNPSMDM